MDINNIHYRNPYLWDGNAHIIGRTGEFKTHMEDYASQPLPLKMSRSYYLPPYENFYIVHYHFENTQSDQPMNIRLFDYVNTAKLRCDTNKAFSFINKEPHVHMVDLRKCGQPMYFACGAFHDVQEFQHGSISGPTSPLEHFQKYGRLNNADHIEDFQVSIGTITNISIKPGEAKDVYFYRILKPTYEEAIKVVNRVKSLQAKDWIALTAKRYQDFLNKGKRPSGLSEEAQKLFDNSVASMKNSQNPQLGAFVASFHPKYAPKTWTRDGIFSAMAMNACGYHDEAKLFLKFLANVQLRQNGHGFHTCYHWLLGSPVGFVDPQFDGAGSYLLALYHYYTITKDASFIESLKTRIREIENFLLYTPAKEGFIPPDYSIWEESSDHYTGRPLDTSYYTFTQAMAHIGLFSASQLEAKVFKDVARQELLLKRADRLRKSIDELMYNAQHGYFVRYLNQTNFQPDLRADASTAAIVWGGVTSHEERKRSHIEYIKRKLTKRQYGIARYEGDPFFYDSIFNPGGKEVGEKSPPWPVTTAFVAFAEFELGLRDVIAKRIDWMVKHAAPEQMPVGEAIDGITGDFVMSSTPDLYEHAGVYLWTVLMYQNKTLLPNPHNWYQS